MGQQHAAGGNTRQPSWQHTYKAAPSMTSAIGKKQYRVQQIGCADECSVSVLARALCSRLRLGDGLLNQQCPHLESAVLRKTSARAYT